jgi:hypothetical protein
MPGTRAMDMFRAFDRVWLGFRLVGYGMIVALTLVMAMSA